MIHASTEPGVDVVTIIGQVRGRPSGISHKGPSEKGTPPQGHSSGHPFPFLPLRREKLLKGQNGWSQIWVVPLSEGLPNFESVVVENQTHSLSFTLAPYGALLVLLATPLMKIRRGLVSYHYPWVT